MCRDSFVRFRRLGWTLLVVLGVAFNGATPESARAAVTQDPAATSTTAPATTAPVSGGGGVPPTDSTTAPTNGAPTTAPPVTAPPVTVPLPPPPPPPQALPVITGIITKLTKEAADAQQALAATQLMQQQLQTQVNDLTAQIQSLEGHLADVNAKIRDTELTIVTAHNTLDSIVVGEYQRLGTSAEVTTVASRSDYSRRQKYGRAVTHHEITVVRALEDQRVELQRDADGTAQQRDQLTAERQSTEQKVNDAAHAVNTAGTNVLDSAGALARWNTIKDGADTPILGKSVLTAAELTDWFTSTKRKTNSTVPIDELARLFIEEGSVEGVRADIAFAQSILETGSFQFPSGGQLNGIDNNFAGIGACDSCPHGYVFPDARTGIRAQIQLLRNYADPTVTAATLANPSVLQNFDRFGLRGNAARWSDLTHRWATADGYGDKILLLYVDILKHATNVK